ncbi:MAG: bifunctional ADP-dependent NAD(P)H-hydrate dehydratase/NAD(P)H-hydrate epimerase [Gammaproteobacteria bacterium]|nr:MAG: bifunctional ADP-dependent NAD(P)H-hydrate dehydratase/NAD(P)H-hydrate epimerase [Gammaproteobacteria bacterium]
MLTRQDFPLLTVTDIRRLEQALFEIEESYAVMQRAALGLFEVITGDFPQALPGQTVHVVLGSGNNAGDGLEVATLLKQAGFSVIAYCVFEQPFSGDADEAYIIAKNTGVKIGSFFSFDCGDDDIIVEALFGIGFDRPAKGLVKVAIEHVNLTKKQQPNVTVYAVDVPTGIVADTGARLGECVMADKTVTFIADKIGLHTSDGKGAAGKVIVKDLGADLCHAHRSATHFYYTYRQREVPQHGNRHKGNFGHTLVVGGNQGMFGATALASVSALKVGVGKASVYSHPDYHSQFHWRGTPLYEVMRCLDISNIAAYSAIVLGPGLGRNTWGINTFDQVIEQLNKQRLLIDADGLYHLSNLSTNELDGLIESSGIDVITPHEAEAARLLDCRIDAIRADKPIAVRQLAQQYRCIAVLKGAGSLISDGEAVWINTTGNINLATAGTGDVLAGMIGGYLAQGLSPLEAALYGVYQHGLAADTYLAKYRQKSMRASDLWQFFHKTAPS